jgi:hypothetical protein
MGRVFQRAQWLGLARERAVGDAPRAAVRGAGHLAARLANLLRVVSQRLRTTSKADSGLPKVLAGGARACDFFC